MVFDDAAALADAAAERVASVLREGEGPRVSLGLSGGTTPVVTCRQLRGLPARWERVDAWLVDERWVPHDHQDSNGRMVTETLLAHVGATFHRPRWAPWLRPDESAAHYEATLRSLHPPQHRPDLVLLGIGVDGHTASLFPGTDALQAERRWYVANEVPALDTWRLTSTFPFLRLARHIWFLVSGEDKAPVMARIAAGEQLPAARVEAPEGEVVWMLDRAAAAELPA
jgi:6-phosphogluconolactonase